MAERAAALAAKARQSSSRGSKRFVYHQMHDDRQPFPAHRMRQGDNPLKEYRGWTRFRWMVHDVRVFGMWESVKKWYYLLDSWRNKGEKIFVGMDDNGNKFWFSNDTPGPALKHGRFVEPADMHHLRGHDPHIAHPAWQQWLAGNLAHSPAQIKARGEWGPHGRMNGGTTVFNVKYTKDIFKTGLGLDPTYVPTNTMILSPWYKLIKEAGFTRYSFNWNPAHFPMLQPHDIKQEVVEDFYRFQQWNNRWSKGHDHDEWRG